MRFFARRRAANAVPDVAQAALAAAQALMDRGQYRAAIDLLTAENRRAASAAIEVQLVRLRHAAFAVLEPTPRPEPWPPLLDDPFPGLRGVPEIAASQLTAAILGGAILHHGSLLVRGLTSEQQAAALAADVDQAVGAYDAEIEGRATPEEARWFTRFDLGAGYTYTEIDRRWGRQSGGQLLVGDSPRALFDVIEAFSAIDFGRLLAEYMGEWPALSFKKSTLRRTPANSETEWHQDGAFLGSATRTVNVWLSCSHCGIDAPSLDVVARRLDGLAETGTGSAAFAWSVAREVADRVAQGDIVRPVFAPGDALLLDQLTLHRTGVSPGMTRTRYAIESWFFAPSTYPRDQVPIVF